MMSPMNDVLFEGIDAVYTEHETLWNHGENRHLAAIDSPSIDFTVLSMAVVTLSMLMIVAVLRHNIDKIAKGRDIFENVLEAVYHELSTLGIVEATIFLVHHYYPDLNIKVEFVFAEVHFTLFFVAIINAIMSCLLYFFASQVAESQWFRLETVDIDHYVAIRKQFDALEEQMQAIKSSEHGGKSQKNIQHQNSSKETNTFIQAMTFSMIPSVKGNIKQMINVKYKSLLVQVRFHELRVHFIESNRLDPRFRVSSYLKLCMNDVFKSLVHISTFSWLILLACTNLMYFATGIIASETNNQEAIGYTFSFIYIGYCSAFILLSFLIAWKMKKIFFKIMKNKQWIKREDVEHMDTDTMNHRNKDESMGANHTHQLDYFWGGDPSFIVIACQVMQFGYALSLAILLVFNKNIFVKKTSFDWVGWYFVTPFLCYILFVWIWSTIIPQFTQCTSLGELVNRRHLNDTQALFELNEAKLIRQNDIDFAEAKGKLLTNSQKKRKRKQMATKKEKHAHESKGGLSFLKRMMTGSTDSPTLASKDDFDLDRSVHSSLSGGEKLVQLSELVKKQSKDLPDIRPTARRPRTRSVSDGVASMRVNIFSAKSALAAEVLRGEAVPDTSSPSTVVSSRPLTSKGAVISGERARSRREKAVSTGVFLMQSEKSRPLVTDPYMDVEDSSSLEPSAIQSLGKCLFPTRISEHEKDEMPLALKQTKFITTICEEDSEIDDHSLSELSTGAKSEGVPDVVDVDVLTAKKTEFNVAQVLRDMFLNKSYRQASAVFGTMVAFFMIAIRIELILLDTCSIDDNQNTWNFISRPTSFWIYVVWLFVFIVEGSTQATLFLRSGSNYNMVIAGIYDCVLSIVCLGIFLRAEVERCCDCDYTTSLRSLAYIDDSGLECDPYHPCCPRFGDRLCGGVGSLEPISSIIALRLFRFMLGRSFINLIQKKDHKECEVEVEPSPRNRNIPNVKTLDFVQYADSKDINFEHYRGTITELWALAIHKYPDIVSEHGVFSGLLLESMLGLEPLPTEEAKEGSRQMHGVVETSMSNDFKVNVDSFSMRRKSMSSRRVHKCIGASISIDGNLTDENDGNLIRPQASLVRSMRRCQYQWLPLLDSWQEVDLVLTKYELVWLATKPLNGFWDQDIETRMDDVKQLLRSHKGGKGVRLSDAVVGREIIGRLPLADIDEIKVQRFPPKFKAQKRKIREHDTENAIDGSNFSNEFWAESPKPLGHYIDSPDERFQKVMEDNLILHSPQGTLCLRFLVDLVDEETGERQQTNIHHFGMKEGALLWCQTISHLCGPRQLKQKLNHFGESLEKELIDFVEIQDRKKGHPFKLPRWSGPHR